MLLSQLWRRFSAAPSEVTVAVGFSNALDSVLTAVRANDMIRRGARLKILYSQETVVAAFENVIPVECRQCRRSQIVRANKEFTFDPAVGDKCF
jgi:hypothetical protein